MNDYKTIRCFALIVLASCDLLFAQVAPYDKPPTIESPYYKVRYEGSSNPGELAYPVSYTVWISPELKLLRGVIVHQHGCGEGSCKSGQTGAFDLHWQSLAKKHGCALVSPTYEQPEKSDCQLWCDPRNGSDAAFQQSLIDLGTQSGHAELSTVPWSIWGHSGGGHWAGGMLLLHPERVAAVWLRSGVPSLSDLEGKPKSYLIPDSATEVPVMCNLGTKEGVTVKDGQFSKVWGGVEVFFRSLRTKGGLVGVAVDPLSSHDCGNQRYLAIPWLDACLSARLPDKQGQPLKPMPKESSWLAPLYLADGNVVAPVQAMKYQGATDESVWLPNEAIATAWSQYVQDTAVADASPPPVPTKIRMDANVLTWAAEADLESGLASFIIERDGIVLANVPNQGKNHFGRPVFQGLQYSDTPTEPLIPMQYTDNTTEPGRAYKYRVIAVNTVGLKSIASD